ncbi:unnamed protein product [Parnassius apollo]|uniref:(apollo) hypothetical protein n=1 Tax=Parnassius apollo TaxID=110799 RepID=A0A8S3W1S9_PARAO|nr:unnamed protein product [Parnassius apollo]
MATRQLLIAAALREERLERRRNRRRLRNQLNISNIPDLEFYDKYGLPAVVGCIDCSHVVIVRLSEHEEQYFNRKHFHSINTQVICDSDLLITNVDASYGGATHDTLEGMEHMMTPVDNAVENSPEGRYNYLQKRACCTIERTFGVLKGRWRCLLAARELHYCPETAGKIILACCVLHNMCIRAGIEGPELTEEEHQSESTRQVPFETAASSTQALQAGRRARNRR